MKEKIIRQGWTNLKLDLAGYCMICSNESHHHCGIKGECSQSLAGIFDTDYNAAKVDYQHCRKVQIIARETP